MREHRCWHARQLGHRNAIALAGRARFYGVQKHNVSAFFYSIHMHIDRAAVLRRKMRELKIMRGKQCKSLCFAM